MLNADKIIVSVLAVSLLLWSNITSINGLSFSSQAEIEQTSKIAPYSNQANHPVTIDASTDKSTYKIGEKVVISGKVSEVAEDEVLVALFGPDDGEITVDYFSVNSDGSFQGSLLLKEDYSPGRYTLEVSYASHIAFIEFFVETKSDGPSSPKINVNTDSTRYVPSDTVTVYGHVPFIEGQLVNVHILYPDNSPYTISQVTPDQSGSFKYSFDLKGKVILGIYTVKVTFSGSSATTTFTVAEPANLTIRMDKTTYFAKEKVEISGTVSGGVEGSSVLIQVLNPTNKLFIEEKVKPNYDGTYSVAFSLTGALAITGLYTVNVSYEEQSVSSSFELTQKETSDTTQKSSNKKTENITSTITVNYAGRQYNLPYSITNTRLLDIKIDQGTMLINIDNNSANGMLQITLPRELIDAKVGAKDASFKVLADGKQINSQEIKKTSTIRTLEILFPPSSKEIRIIGTKVEVQNEDHEKLASETKTILFLSPLPKVVTAGEELTFTGILKTSGRGALQQATVWIKSIDTSGSEANIASGVTDSAGRFTIKWLPKSGDEGKRFNTFAVFDGDKNYVKSRSSIFSVDIEKQKVVENKKVTTGSLSLRTDKDAYDLNDTVILSGSVKSVGRSDTVGVFVFDPKERYFMVAEAKIQSDNSFTYPFWLPEDHAVPGIYTVKIEYAREVVTTTFLLGQITEITRSQTILQLNQPISEITRGDIVLFTGILKRESGLAVQNSTIWIKYKTSDGNVLALTFGQTDEDGRFAIKWVADNIGFDEALNVFAHFEGGFALAGAASKEFQINVDNKLEYISVRTDKTYYSIGETVKVTGKINSIVNGVPATIQVFSPKMSSFKFATIEVNSGGNLEYEFKLRGELAITGKYTIKVSYLEKSVIMEVEVNGSIVQPIKVKEVSIIDSIGFPVYSPTVDQQVFIKTVLRNTLNLEQEFTYIVQIKDADGFTVMLDWMPKQVSAGEELRVEIPWTPESEGHYNAYVFVWQELNDPTPFLPSPSVASVTVKA